MPRKDRAELLHALTVLGRYFTQSNIREALHVSLHIEHRHDPGTRRELRERIASLLGAHAAALTCETAPEGYEADTVRQFNEQLKGLYTALTDSGVSNDELSELGGHLDAADLKK